MGCQAISKSLSDENAFITTQEQSLGFGKHSAAVLEANFYRLMSQDLMQESHFLSLCETLQLDSRAGIAYKHLAVKEGFCDGRKLLLYALLLSKGSDIDKAVSLWNMYETPGERELTPTRLQQMITDVLSVSLSIAVEVSHADPKTMPEERLKAYLSANTPKIPKAVKEIIPQFPLVCGKLQKTSFIEMIRSKTAVITNTKAVRMGIEQTKVMPTRFAAAFLPGAGFQAAL